MNQPPVPPELVPDLERVEAVILEHLRARSIITRVSGQHTISTNGHIRVALILLAAKLGQYDLPNVIHSAAAVELIHIATSVHNKLTDERSRRGTADILNTWNGDITLMVGDYLFALAASEMALAPDPRIIAYFSHAVMAFCEGELAPVMGLEPRDIAIKQYLYKIGRKTAALFEAACKAGMVCSHGTQEQIDALGQFGYNLGLAYQIVDDVLDYVGDQSSPGKPAGNDLRAGIITLPLIYAMETTSDAAIVSAIETLPSDTNVHWVIDEVLRTGAHARALADARQYSERALGYLASFKGSPAKAALEDLVRFVADQTYI